MCRQISFGSRCGCRNRCGCRRWCRCRCRCCTLVGTVCCAMACRRPFGIVFFSFNSHVSTGLHIICSPGTEAIEKNFVVFVTFDCYSFCIFKFGISCIAQLVTTGLGGLSFYYYSCSCCFCIDIHYLGFRR